MGLGKKALGPVRAFEKYRSLIRAPRKIPRPILGLEKTADPRSSYEILARVGIAIDMGCVAVLYPNPL